jgi:hypothetical protein
MSARTNRKARGPMPSWILGLAVLGAVLGRPPLIAAQAGVPYAELQGRVHIAGDTMSLGGALIEAVGTAANTVARRDGTYRLTGLPIGPITLRVRLLGLASRTVDVEITEPGVRVFDIAMSRLPQALSEVRINGEVRKVPPRFDDVYRRMSVANGTFFTREDIDRMNPFDMFSVLGRVPLARVNDTSITFAKCLNAGARLGDAGPVQIWIDGQRMTRTFAPNEQREVLSLVTPSQVQAIEVYTSTSRIPAEFLEDACAVIAIWTR